MESKRSVQISVDLFVDLYFISICQLLIYGCLFFSGSIVNYGFIYCIIYIYKYLANIWLVQFGCYSTTGAFFYPMIPYGTPEV